MDCESARVAVSAALDAESVPDETDLAAHLAECVDCVAWRAEARAMGETVAAGFSAAPDLTEPLLRAVTAQVAAEESARRAVRAARRRVLRLAVGVAAVAQLVLAIPALLAATGVADLAAVHTSREMASFDIAVAVGFLLAAIRPERARAFVPVAFVLAVCLAGTSLFDLASGFTAVADETGHMVAVIQAGLLWALGRNESGASPPRVTSAVTT